VISSYILEEMGFAMALDFLRRVIGWRLRFGRGAAMVVATTSTWILAGLLVTLNHISPETAETVEAA
jgi:hypothetical protein